MDEKRQVYYLKVWEGIEGLVFGEISNYVFSALFRSSNKANKWLFHGKFATVGVITEDGGITREMALVVAYRYITGEYMEYDYDLDKCVVVKKKGIKKTPRY